MHNFVTHGNIFLTENKCTRKDKVRSGKPPSELTTCVYTSRFGGFMAGSTVRTDRSLPLNNQLILPGPKAGGLWSTRFQQARTAGAGGRGLVSRDPRRRVGGRSCRPLPLRPRNAGVAGPPRWWGVATGTFWAGVEHGGLSVVTLVRKRAQASRRPMLDNPRSGYAGGRQAKRTHSDHQGRGYVYRESANALKKIKKIKYFN